MNQNELQDTFKLFKTNGSGIESLLWGKHADFICARLARLNSEPLSKVQLNQLLGFSEERAVSDGFFKFYWLSDPSVPYKLSVLDGFQGSYSGLEDIRSIEQFFYGLRRIFIDGLLNRGNVRNFYRSNCHKSFEELVQQSRDQLFDTAAIKRRGPPLPFDAINRDERYLISEMACKSYGSTPKSAGELKDALVAAWRSHSSAGGGRVSIRDLLSGRAPQLQMRLQFSADDILDDEVESEADVERTYGAVADKFISARKSALKNTALYLSLVNDLDVYVATSMRTRDDFRAMADQCEEIFQHESVKDLHLRYFDPTLSAAEGHEDKGLIECLMVKCAKVLVYCAGEKESYGKDAEAAMALSLGKPVIFLCNEETRSNFYREVHPLSRLINFTNGVAVGAIVTTDRSQVSELLDRIFENEMEYDLAQPADRPGYLQLKERLTGSVVRIQTNDSMLTEAFWNYYRSHSDRRRE